MSIETNPHDPDRQPGPVGAELPRRQVVERHAVLEIADRVLDLGVAAVIGLERVLQYVVRVPRGIAFIMASAPQHEVGRSEFTDDTTLMRFLPVLAVLTRVRPPEYAVPDEWSDFDEGARRVWWTAFRADIWERDEINVLVELRNLMAHSPPGRVVTPVDSARSLLAVAAFIDDLWPGDG